MNTAGIEQRDALVRKEKLRLAKLYRDIPEKKKRSVEGLIIQAARLRVLLDEMWIDISEDGDYNMFSQSPNQEPYERERPVAKLYNARNDSYLRIIKQLTDFLPEESSRGDPVCTDGSDLL